MILPGSTERIKGTFVDENNVPYDPNSIAITVYDSAGVSAATATEANCVYVQPGIWYYDFVSTGTAPVGRWNATWKNTVGSKSWVYPFQFIVWDVSWPTVAMVRSFLAGMGAKRVGDPSMEELICDAAVYVNYNKGEDAPVGNVYQAILARAVYLCYTAYIAEFERTAGRMPDAIDRQLRRYETLSDKAMLGVQSGAVSGLITMSELRSNAIEDNP